MNHYQSILSKLNGFVSKYYKKQLLIGALLFLALGLLFFIVIFGVEHFLWLGSSGRFILLVVFLLSEVFLLAKYIVTPLFYLFKLKKGISNRDASIVIGKHFPDVGDKLVNLLDLASDKQQSELLLASIEQRSKNLSKVPFTSAIKLQDGFKYAKYVLIPLVLIGLLWVSGDISSFFGSYKRVVNYDIAYEPPAPFAFHLLSDSLTVLEDQPVIIQVMTKGEYRPEQAYIVVNGESFLLENNGQSFQFRFTPPLVNSSFHFTANDVASKTYELNVLKTPFINDFSIQLEYPSYIKKNNETLNGTGNATIPEGTKVHWAIEAINTNNINLVLKDTALAFKRHKNNFDFTQVIYNNTDYQLSTKNDNVIDHEVLSYQLTVVKDQYPSIKIEETKDSINPNVAYYFGELLDDYQINKLRLVCYPSDNEEDKQMLTLDIAKSNVEQFYYTFPSGLDIDPEIDYSFYFQVTDNDAIRKGKSTKSRIFSASLYSKNQLKEKSLENQKGLLNQLDNSLDKFKEQRNTLDELSKNQKEKQKLDFNDKNEVKDFLHKQKQQERLMQKFSKELQQNLDQDSGDNKDNKLLQERLQRQELQAKKNEKLLEELQKVSDKINKEELAKRLEELSKSQQNSERNLEQLLELTKQYYVTEKTAQLAEDIKELAEEQLELAQDSLNNTKGNQEKLSKEFQDFKKELDALQKDNQELKKPLDIKRDKGKEDQIQQEQNDAEQELNKKNEDADKPNPDAKSKAAKSQKSASDKMKEISESLQQSGGGSSESSIAEDAEMLRQILDNLITFSFKQESLYDQVSKQERQLFEFSETVRSQKELRGLFEHVDDSLFALSLRRAEISEFVNEQITEVYYNIDKSLERIADNQVYYALSNQKTVVSSANTLADFLANILDNMQQSMKSGSGSGSGKSQAKSKGKGSGRGFQLPDIIKKQGALSEKMQGKSKGKGEEGKQAGGKNSGKQDGNKEKDGQEGENEGEGKGTSQNSKQQGSKESGNGESESAELYEIFKQQELIRQQLEKQLADMIQDSDKKLTKKVLQLMEDFENDLLENGITERTANKANNIQHQLMKLENASLKQGQKSERESIANKRLFNAPIMAKPAVLEKYRNETEILNRQALPLHQIFQNKVQRYFKVND